MGNNSKVFVTKKDLTGQKFERLTVIKYIGASKNQKSLFLCLCDCGNEIIAIGGNLQSGTTKSCGCLKKDKMLLRSINANYKKPHWNRIRSIYYNMVSRCYHINNKCYKRYGNRNITVCNEWLGKKGLYNFYDWATNNGYCKDLSLDRINNNGNYEPSNCRWVDDYIQANNRSNNHRITYMGEEMTISNFARHIGQFENLRKINRLINSNMSPEEVVINVSKEKNKNE